MKNFKIILLAILAGLLSFSCEKDIVLDLGDVEQQLVVEGWIANGQSPVVLLSTTYPTYGTVNFIDLLDSIYLNGADITVTDANGTTVSLVETTIANLTLEQKTEIAIIFDVSVDFLSVYPLPVYTDTSNTIIGQEYGSYQLDISYKDKVLTASTTIPTFIPLDSLSYKKSSNSDTLYNIFLNLTLPPVMGNYIRYATKVNGENFYYPDGANSLGNDAIFGGQQNVSFPANRGYSSEDEIEIDEVDLFAIGDTVTLQWKNMDKTTYDFWNTLLNDGGDSPFSSPVKALSNVNGGLGIWGGYYISYASTIIE